MTAALGDVPFLVLAALAGGRRHGYDLIRVVATLTEGQVRLGAGTLYGAIDRLVTAALITTDGDEVVAGRLRRYYVLTPDGGVALAAETSRRERVTAAVRERLALPGGPDAVAGGAA